MDADQRAAHIVNAWQDAWNASDMDALMALFADDSHWVNVVGMHWQGKRAVEHAHRAYFDLMFRGVAQRLEQIEHVAVLPGGTLVVVARWWMDSFREPDGATKPAHRNRMTIVIVPDGDRDLIVHGMNVTIDEYAQQFDPARTLTAAA
jgi:uncharacterized protein (TIGR02246 family)